MLGKFLKEKRIQKKISFDSVCSKLGVYEDYVSFLEEGQIFSFSKERIKAITLAYSLNEKEYDEFLELIGVK